MKIKIAILGATGSIGKNLFNIIKKNKHKYNVILLSANKNYKELLRQAKILKVRNLILTDKKKYNYLLRNKLYNNLNLFNNFNDFKKIFKYKKVDYTLSAITGIAGLLPTLKIIKYTKKIAIANKEAIICGWKFIKNELKKNNVSFIPVDSEHFSTWYGIKNSNFSNIKKIYLTASGGPFLKKKKNLDKIKIADALSHPTWRMGKKISIDSSTMMNKVFEIIEAQKIFNIPYSKLGIIIHPKSYVHSIILFYDKMIKIIAHHTSMSIPIYNSLHENSILNTYKNTKSSKLNLEYLNSLNLTEIDKKQFKLIKIINSLPSHNSLYETAIISANDELVKLYLEKNITFTEISNKLLKFLKKKEILDLKKKKKFSLNNIYEVNKYVRLNIVKNS